VEGGEGGEGGGCRGVWRVWRVSRRQIITHHVRPLRAIAHALEHWEDEGPIE